ncbi:MAG: PKD domain-containing protein [Bacteroidales bacterium]|nr:PKD domain-containing protein [Bacteroidales bacterium]MCF6342629.1 PKD domain-containing protein [Bacteroidales bacterium]
MKKLILAVLSIVLFSTTFFWASCRKTGDDEGWTEEDKASYEEVLNLQDEVSNNLDDWFLSMDSLDAINRAQQSFEASPSVTEATINSKGIAVQYANGMRGGLFLKGKLFDYKKSTDSGRQGEDINAENDLKSLVNGRKMLQMDAAYSEFSYYTDQVHNLNSSNLSRVGIGVTDYLKDGEVTLDRLTQLAGYGIIDMSGHGIPWPKEDYITEIYYVTGETASENTSQKYWDEIKTGSIPVIKTMRFTNGTKYCVSPDFISSHNDFGNDTLFFYGGFCFSFLGGWPDIIDDFGDGAYLGFDWSVQGYHCANWDINSLAFMSDTSKTAPMNLEDWMNDAAVDKSYNESGRTISIHYTGDGKLTLWGDISVKLIALSDDGAPVSNPGEAGVAYPFKCEVVSDISELEYVWDIGDGSSPVTASNAVNITWSEDGAYLLKVEVIDKSNGSSIGSATANVSIGTQGGVKEFMLTSDLMRCYFGSGGSTNITIWDNPSLYGTDWAQIADYGNLEWSGLSFSGTLTEGDGTSWSNTNTISGTLSSDGQTVSFVAEQEGFTNTIHKDYYYYKMTVSQAPLYHFEPPSNTGNGQANYGVEDGQNAQNYVTAFEGQKWTDEEVYATVTGIDWNKVANLISSFNKID